MLTFVGAAGDRNSMAAQISLGTLSKLPAEIRVIIYEFATAKQSNRARIDPTIVQRINAEEPTVLRVNSTIRKEALPIFYQINDFVTCTFVGGTWSDGRAEKIMLKWLRCIGASGRRSAKEVLQRCGPMCWCKLSKEQNRTDGNAALQLLIRAVLPGIRTLPGGQFHVFNIEGLELD